MFADPAACLPAEYDPERCQPCVNTCDVSRVVNRSNVSKSHGSVLFLLEMFPFLQAAGGDQPQPLVGELAEEVARRVHTEACLVEMRQFNTAVLEQAQVAADTYQKDRFHTLERKKHGTRS